MTNRQSIVTQLAAAHFVADAAQVEALAHELYNTQGAMRAADGTYLKVLIVACQGQLGKPPRRKAADVTAQLGVLEKVNEVFYAAVLRGVSTPEVQPDPTLDKTENSRRSVERNRRSTFARSVKSTLAGFINAGGDLRVLEAAATTKAMLRAFVDQGRDLTQRGNAMVARASRAILEVVREEATQDLDAARERLEGLIESLQEALDALPETPTEPMVPRTPAPPRPRHIPRGQPAPEMRPN